MNISLLLILAVSKYMYSCMYILYVYLQYTRYGMSNLIDRVGGSIDALPGGDHFSSWTGELSPGEMQIISFLRLLYHHQSPNGKFKENQLSIKLIFP